MSQDVYVFVHWLINAHESSWKTLARTVKVVRVYSTWDLRGYYFKDSRGRRETPQLETKALVVPCTAEDICLIHQRSMRWVKKTLHIAGAPGLRVHLPVTETTWYWGMDKSCNLVHLQECARLLRSTPDYLS